MVKSGLVSDGDVRAVLATILDPEMPVNLVDLGLIEHIAITPVANTAASEVAIGVLPTFVGCPALDMIRDLVRTRVGELPGVARVAVNFRNDPPWSTDRITAAGREALRQHGVTVPKAGGSAARSAGLVSLTVSGIAASRANDEQTDPVPCPFCSSTNTEQESRFGPTRCRMIYYCPACKNSFEHLKHI